MRCPLFVELCAGTAALSLRLHHPRARPPVSRMGAKTGYADVILRCMGLRPGQGSADGTRYLWCEPDAGVRLLLHAYRDRAVSLGAAEIIRGWKDEDPRALWERLRAEGPARCPPVDPAEVARFLYGTAASYGGLKGSLWDTFLHPEEGGRYGAARADVADKTATLPTVEATIATDARHIDPREVARYARILTANRLVNPDPETWQNTGRGGYKHGGADFCTPAADLAARFTDAVEVPGAAVVDDARKVDPREVARWTFCHARTHRIGDGYAEERDPRPGRTGFQGQGPDRWALSDRFTDAPTLPATITDDARKVDPREVARFGLLQGGCYNNYPIDVKQPYPDYNRFPPKGNWPVSIAEAMENTATIGATITDDARAVDPREVARWSLIQANEWRGNAVIERDGELWAMAGEVGRTILRRVQMVDGRDLSLKNLSDQFRATPDPLATITDDARAVEPSQLPAGVVVYIDPPYENTTGYAHAFPRSEWLPIVRRWAEAGALVVVSEAEPIPELMAEGWHAVEITGERKGQKRTFSKQQREWLTMSRAPAWKPSEQMGLFHGRS